MTRDREPPSLFRWPVLAGVLPLHRAQIPTEIIAGITLAALAIPEVMGYTKISGTPVITGLYTLLVPACLFALLGSSRHLVVGADSATAAILASGLVGMAAVGTGEYLALASLLALMVGALLIVASAVGLGFMADFLSKTVLVGFLSGVGVPVAAHALSELLGVKAAHHDIATLVGALWEGGVKINTAALTVAAAVLAVIGISTFVSKRLGFRIPGPMIAVIGAVLASWMFDLKAHLPVVGTVPAGLPDFSLPDVDWSLSLIWQLFPTAFSMVVVVLAQSAATSRAYAARYNERLNEEQDLFGLGFANLGAALSRTFVVNGSPTKTEMVDAAGGRSQLSLLVAAVVVLVTLLFLTKPLSYLPDAVLSSIVFLIGVKLIDMSGLKSIYRQRRTEFWLAMATAAVVVTLGVEKGILFAILFSLIVHTRHGYRPKNLLIVRERSGEWRARELDSGAQVMPGLLIYRFGHSMYYANTERMQEEVSRLVKTAKPPLKWFCIDTSPVDDIDYTAAAALRKLMAKLQTQSIRLVFVQDIGDINSASRQELEALSEDIRVFGSLDEVLKAYERESHGHAAGNRT